MHKVSLLILFALLLAACGEGQEFSPSPAATTAPAETATPRPVATGTALPSPTPELTALPARLENFPIAALALAHDPHDQRAAYALLETNQLYHTQDRGATWERLALPAPRQGAPTPVPDQAASVAYQDIVVSDFRSGQLWVRTAGTLYHSADGGETWEELLQDVHVWAVDYEGLLLYAVRTSTPEGQDGLYASEDGGETWTRRALPGETWSRSTPPSASPEPPNRAGRGVLSLMLDPASLGNLYLGTAEGIYRSFNGGISWQAFNTGLLGKAGRVPILASGSSFDSLFALVEIQDGEEKTYPVLAQLTHGQVVPDHDRWQVVGEEFLASIAEAHAGGFYGIYTLIPDPERSGPLHLGTQRGVYISQDFGQTWQPAEPLSGPPAVRIAVSPGVDTQFYVWTGEHLVAAAMAGAAPVPTDATPPLAKRVSLEIEEQYGGSFQTFAVAGGIAYLGIGPRLVVVDISDPANPTELGRSDVLPGLPGAIALAKDQAYLLTRDAVLIVLDISDPSHPRFVKSMPARPERSGTLPSWAGTDHLAIEDSLAYFTETGCREDRCQVWLRIADISDPSQIKEAGALELPGRVVALFVEAEQAYVAHEGGLLVVDVSDPFQPRQLSNIPLGYVNAAAFAPPYAYVNTDQLQVIDISDPAAPVRAAVWQPDPGYLYASEIAISGGFLYLFSTLGEFGHCWSSMLVIDVSEPAAPLLLEDTDQSPGFRCAWEALADGGRLLVRDWDGLQVVDLGDPSQPRLAGLYNAVPFGVQDMVVSDGLIYWGDGLAGASLHVWDLRDANSPRAFGPFSPGWADGGAISGNYLYLPVWENGLSVVDVRQPTQPREAAGLTTEELKGSGENVVVAGVYLLVTVGESGLRVVDVSDPIRPRPAGAHRSGAAGESAMIASGLAVSGDSAYLIEQFTRGVTSTGRLVILDLRNPLEPEPLGSLDIGEPVSLARPVPAGDYLYLAVASCDYQCTGSLQVVDVSNPAIPSRVSAMPMPTGAFDVAIFDSYALVAGGDDGIWVVDVSDPSDPSLVGHLDTPGSARRLAVQGETIYVADDGGGLLKVRLDDF